MIRGSGGTREPCGELGRGWLGRILRLRLLHYEEGLKEGLKGGLMRRVLFGSVKNGVSKVRDGGGLGFGWWGEIGQASRGMVAETMNGN